MVVLFRHSRNIKIKSFPNAFNTNVAQIQFPTTLFMNTSRRKIDIMNNEIEAYLDNLKMRSRTETTIKMYRYVLYRCIGLLKDNKMRYHVKDIGNSEILFLLNNLDVKESTKKNYIAILGMFCRYHTKKDPVSEMGILWNRPDRIRKFIGPEEFKELVKISNPTERLVLILGAFTGMRRKEIAELRFDDIGNDSVLIHGKGHGTDGKVRSQPITSFVIDEILRYMEWKKHLKGKDMSEGRLLVFRRKGIILSFKDRLSALSNMVSRLGRRNGLDISCHSLRRLYCTSLVAEGCPIETVKELMRHSNINTTIECYIDPQRLNKRGWSERSGEAMRSMLMDDTIRKDDEDLKSN